MRNVVARLFVVCVLVIWNLSVSGQSDEDCLACHDDPEFSIEKEGKEISLFVGILDDLMITNAGDHLFLVVNGAWLAERGRIVVMEEQVSSHGGLGGPQTEPFILLPADWKVGRMDLESPEALHQFLARQLDRICG